MLKLGENYEVDDFNPEDDSVPRELIVKKRILDDINQQVIACSTAQQFQPDVPIYIKINYCKPAYFNFKNFLYLDYDQLLFIRELMQTKIFETVEIKKDSDVANLFHGSFLVDKEAFNNYFSEFIKNYKEHLRGDIFFKFDRRSGVLSFGSIILKIRKSTNQFEIANLLFRRNHPVMELADVWEKISGEEYEKSKGCWRKCYDAITALNRKIESVFGVKKFILWDGRTIKLNPSIELKN